MRQSNHGHIDLGDGGFILNTEANEQLLRQLRETPPLSPAQLLKLAKSYKVFPTQVSLGNHIALLALTKPDMQKDVFPEYAGIDWNDFIEDVLGDAGHDENTEQVAQVLFNKAEPTKSFIQLSARWIRVSGIGLLIETVDYKENASVKHADFVVGVSSNPAKLPDA